MSELTEMEKYLQKLFSTAGHDLQKKFLKYTQDFQRLEAQKQAAVDKGDMTEEEFAEWRKNKLLYGMHWRRLIDRNTAELVKYNQTAVKYINGETPQIFASGYNSVAEQIPDSPVAGFDFELINADTVNNLIHEEGITLPKKKLDPEKDKQWNAKQINAQILQGIMQGESIPKMAKRMLTVANSDLAGATRTARTMHTAAQNCGRQAGYNKAAKDGIIFEKTWLAANQPGRTRDTHLALSGTTIPYDEKFVTDAGNELEFPGDWRAPAEEVYNCRCTMITKFKGFMSLKDAENVPDRETPKGNKAEDYEWIGDKTESVEAPEKEETKEEVKEPTFADRISSFREELQHESDPVKRDAIINNAGREMVERAKRYPVDMQRIKEEFEKKKQELQNQIETLKQEKRGLTYLRSLISGQLDKRKEIENRIKELEKQMCDNNRQRTKDEAQLKEELKKDLKEMLSEVRSVGTTRDINEFFSQGNKGTKAKEKMEIVKKAFQDYPTEWIEKIHKYREDSGLSPIGVLYADRGFYSHHKGTLNISNRGGDGTLTAYHELGHCMEAHIPEIVDAEKVFYERRTAGEELKWVGTGKKSEVGRKDNFIDAYMGKDYGGSYYELVSMGFEKFYVNPEELLADEDYFNFIAGVLMLC